MLRATLASVANGIQSNKYISLYVTKTDYQFDKIVYFVSEQTGEVLWLRNLNWNLTSNKLK